MNLKSLLRESDEMTVQQWQAFFHGVYGARNEERFPAEYGLSRMWLHLVQDMAALAKGIRKNDVARMLRMLPRLFCWLCGFCTKAGFELEEIVWHFFPYVCPTCWSPTCACGANKRVFRDAPQKDEKTLAEFREANAEKRPSTLDGFVVMFADVYGNHSESGNLTDVYLHFSEEVGEVAEWIRVVESLSDGRSEAQQGLTSELADVFSWMCKLCWRINCNLQGFGPWAEHQFGNAIDQRRFEIRFAAITSLQYGNGCPGCGQAVCARQCEGWDTRLAKASHQGGVVD